MNCSANRLNMTLYKYKEAFKACNPRRNPKKQHAVKEKNSYIFIRSRFLKQKPDKPREPANFVDTPTPAKFT